MAFESTPVYQEAVLKRLSKDEMAILDDLNRIFAKAEGRKQLGLARMGAEKESGRKRRVFRGEEAEALRGLKKARMEATTGMSREDIEQRRTLGLARLASQAKRYRMGREFYEGQLPAQRFLGYGNILASGLTGYAGMKAGFAQAERDREITELYKELLRRKGVA